MSDAVGEYRAAPARAGRPVRHAGLVEKSIKNQLLSTSEQIRQAHLAFGSEEAIVLFNERHRHSSPSGCQRLACGGGDLPLAREFAKFCLIARRRDRWSDRRIGCERDNRRLNRLIASRGSEMTRPHG